MVWNEHRMNTDKQELKEVIDVWHISTQAKMRSPKINAGKTVLDTQRQSVCWFGETVKYTYFSLRLGISCIDLSQERSSTATSGIWTSAAEISMKKDPPRKRRGWASSCLSDRPLFSEECVSCLSLFVSLTGTELCCLWACSSFQHPSSSAGQPSDRTRIETPDRCAG